MNLFSLPKSKRLISNKQFKAVLSRRLRVSDDMFILYIAENDCGYRRLGVSVGKSCGGAVVRNRLKRLMREAFRQSQQQIPAGFDYVLMVSSDFLKKTYHGRDVKKFVKQLKAQQVKESFLNLVNRAVR